VDPPEAIYFIREHYPDVIVDKPGITMWQLIVKKGMPPTRKVRYCCDVLKEGGGRGRIAVTGVRWEESTKRKNNRGLLELNNYTRHYIKLMNDNDEARRMFETCTMKSMHTLNPIIDWTSEDVWEYLNSRNIPHCCLYDEGFERIGCIGCPLAGPVQMRKEFARYPKYEQAYLRAFEKMLKAREGNGKPYQKWKTADDVMRWWLSEEKQQKVDEDQLSFALMEE
jgi:phosphoadenosine phosphosulfate reductase